MSVRAAPEPQDYYPYLTRSILRLFKAGALTNVVSVDVEPDYGYATRLTYANGSCRVTIGYNPGLNVASSSDLAKDKGYAKFILRSMGVNCPDGGEFLLPWWYDAIGRSQQAHGNQNVRETTQAPAYVGQTLGYPVYVKPVDGSKGLDIFVAENQAELEDILQLYEAKRVRVAVIEAPIHLPDYRIVCLDGQLISAYRRVPLAVVGDGKSTISELVANLQRRYDREGRDTALNINDSRLRRHMAQHNLRADTVLSAQHEVALMPISNLSAGGTSQDVTGSIHKRWVDLAVEVARNFNLRLIGLDLACADITAPDADYSVIEVNSSPGLDHYASSGDAQRKIVDDLYVKVLNAFPN